MSTNEMRRGRRVAAITCAFAAAAAVSTGPSPVGAEAPPAGRDAGLTTFGLAEFGRQVFTQRCGNCHAAIMGAPSIAPPLIGIIGRRAGSAEGYTYSAKLAGSDLVWTAATLTDWLAISTIATPDIRFRHAGINDAIQRAAVVAFLASLDK